MEPWRLLNQASAEQARALLTTCCGSARWVARMLERRPFDSQIHLLTAAREEWYALESDDWREAFDHHPTIGDREALHTRFAATRNLSAREQAGVTGASDAALDALSARNQAYRERFGYIFIVCAAGKGAEEMLTLLGERLSNEPAIEMRIAMEEHAKITALRLDSLSHANASEPDRYQNLE